ncbi:Uncharacterised protein [Mycobacteroides abscessus subsp. abscessus]|nr:Uncharacterised protein [Mycobacteroides abscessus subsp. abscessus]
MRPPLDSAGPMVASTPGAPLHSKTLWAPSPPLTSAT